MIPDWCIHADNGEKRGQIVIYAPKSDKEFMTTYFRSKNDNRYDQQFDLIFITDDVRDLINSSETFGSNIPNSQVLTLPIELPYHLKPICFWPEGNVYGGNNTQQVFLAWRKDKRGHTYFIQQVAKRSIKEDESIESFRLHYTFGSEVMLSVDLDNHNNMMLVGFLQKNR